MNPLVLDPACCAFRQLLAFDPDVAGLARALDAGTMFRRCARAGAASTHECVRFHADEEELAFPLGRISLGETAMIVDVVSEEREAHLLRALETACAGHWEWDERRTLSWEDALERPQALAFAGAPWTKETVAAFFLRCEWVYEKRADLKRNAPFEFAGTPTGRARLEAILPQALGDLRHRFPSFPDWNPADILEILSPMGARDGAAGAPAEGFVPEPKSPPR